MDNARAIYPVNIDPVVVSASKAAAKFTGVASGDQFGISVALDSDGSTALVGAVANDTSGSSTGAAYLFQPPYVTLTNFDLYLGTGATTLYGSRVQTGFNLPASTDTTDDGVNLTGKTSGTYSLIVTEAGRRRC